MTRPQKILVLAGLLVACTVAVLAGARFLRDPAPVGTLAAPASLASGPAAGQDSAERAPPSTSGPTREARERTAAEAGTAQDPRAADPPVGATVEVRIVDGRSGEAVAGTTARWAELPAVGSWSSSPAWGLATIDAWLEEHGHPIEVDLAGRAQVPVANEGRSVVAARAPGLWGRAMVEAGADEPVRLELVPDATLEVRTVAESGVGLAQVPVALRVTRDGWSSDRAVQSTGPDGITRFHHVGVVLAAGPHGAIWSLGLAALLPEPVEQRLDLAALPQEPIVLVVPATGTLEVAVESIPGGPPLGGYRVSISPVGEASSAARPSFWTQRPRLTEPVRDGRALFTHVALGLELDLEGQRGDSSGITRLRTPGPVLAGETTRVTLTLGADHPVLRLRLIDVQGQPVVEARLRTELEQATVFSTSTRGDDLETDAEGQLFYELDTDWVEGTERRLSLSVVEGAGHARLDLAREFPPGLTDLGDVRLAVEALLASGRVVDPTGAPLEGASVEVSIEHLWEGHREWFEWRDDLTARSGPDGAFEVRGEVESNALQLRARAEGLAAETLEVPVGSAGLVLALRATGRIEGRVLLGPDAPFADLIALAQAPGLDETQRSFTSDSSAQLASDGSFVIAGLAAGLHDLVVRARQSSTELARVEGVLVPPGEASGDPRLDPIDLRGRVCAFTLELVPPRPGAGVSGVIVARTAGAAAGGEDEERRFFQGERVPFLSLAPALDLEILAQGCRRVRLQDVRDDMRVELREGPLVRLRLPPDVELPPPPRYLKAFLGSEGDFWQLGHMQDAVFGEDRELVVRPADAGSLQVRWLLEERTETTLSTTTLGEAEPQTVEVLDVAGEQLIHVAPPSEAYAAALERWRIK